MEPECQTTGTRAHLADNIHLLSLSLGGTIEHQTCYLVTAATTNPTSLIRHMEVLRRGAPKTVSRFDRPQRECVQRIPGVPYPREPATEAQREDSETFI